MRCSTAECETQVHVARQLAATAGVRVPQPRWRGGLSMTSQVSDAHNAGCVKGRTRARP